MTANKMMPTYGKRPEGLKDYDIVWMQYRDGEMRALRVGDMRWDWDGDEYDIVAYCKTIMPEPYIPSPDYSKWIGKPCWFWDEDEATRVPRIFKGSALGKFYSDAEYSFKHCRPVTADEIVKE